MSTPDDRDARLADALRNLFAAFSDGGGPKLTTPNGMNLRDYFAGHALAGLLAAPSDNVSQDAGPNARGNPAHAAVLAYDFAEQMMQERVRRAIQHKRNKKAERAALRGEDGPTAAASALAANTEGEVRV